MRNLDCMQCDRKIPIEILKEAQQYVVVLVMNQNNSRRQNAFPFVLNSSPQATYCLTYTRTWRGNQSGHVKKSSAQLQHICVALGYDRMTDVKMRKLHNNAMLRSAYYLCGRIMLLLSDMCYVPAIGG